MKIEWTRKIVSLFTLQKYCEAFGTNLAVIETPAEESFINGYLQRLTKGEFYSSAWLIVKILR